MADGSSTSLIEVISRDAARARGLKRYFTGTACIYGHVAPRLLSSQQCAECFKTPRDKSLRVRRIKHEVLTTRLVALAAGMIRYFTGIPCPNGHLSERYTKTRGCIKCARLKTLEWKERNADRMRQYHQKLYRKRMSIDGAREHASAKTRKWAAENPAKVRVQSRVKQSSKRDRTPAWADKDQIRAIYAAAEKEQQTTGIKMHVDHIVPLKGRLVSGLHVPENLRVVPAIVNLKKQNTFDVSAA